MKICVEFIFINYFKSSAVVVVSFLTTISLNFINFFLPQACSGKFMPIKQFMYFDAYECLDADEMKPFDGALVSIL